MVKSKCWRTSEERWEALVREELHALPAKGVVQEVNVRESRIVKARDLAEARLQGDGVPGKVEHVEEGAEAVAVEPPVQERDLLLSAFPEGEEEQERNQAGPLAAAHSGQGDREGPAGVLLLHCESKMVSRNRRIWSIKTGSAPARRRKRKKGRCPRRLLLIFGARLANHSRRECATPGCCAAVRFGFELSAG